MSYCGCTQIFLLPTAYGLISSRAFLNTACLPSHPTPLLFPYTGMVRIDRNNSRSFLRQGRYTNHNSMSPRGTTIVRISIGRIVRTRDVRTVSVVRSKWICLWQYFSGADYPGIREDKGHYRRAGFNSPALFWPDCRWGTLRTPSIWEGGKGGGGLSRHFMCLFISICEVGKQLRRIWRWPTRWRQQLNGIWVDLRCTTVGAQYLLFNCASLIHKAVLFHQTVVFL